MDSITLENYRCFGEPQTVRLAPLTLLVGENSTGKTSFLALVRALWDVASTGRIPNFREEPYDLGSFEDIAHSRGSRGSRASSFKAGFTATSNGSGNHKEPITNQITFSELDSAPFPVERRVAIGDSWIQIQSLPTQQLHLEIGIGHGEWGFGFPDYFSFDRPALYPMHFLLYDIMSEIESSQRATQRQHQFVHQVSGERPSEEDYQAIRTFARRIQQSSSMWIGGRPFASAPVRSRPRRTYDPVRPTRDSEGESTPSYLAEVYRRSAQDWVRLKAILERFGHELGVFDEINIKPFKKGGSGPFQIEVRKFDRGMKGPKRNFIDVGYGVSQILPVLTDISREDSSSLALFQQPEIHLHPKAQAALGSLFCDVLSTDKNANGERQIFVETHSDYLIDRVRMEIRDRQTSLTPEDVSILFFERIGLDVKIHSIRIDHRGNVVNAPPSYRQFFITEVERSIGFDFDV